MCKLLISHAARILANYTIDVIYCDAAVQSMPEFAPSEPILLEPKGGGETDFRPAFEWVEQNGIMPACLIYLTDLCCRSYSDPPGYPSSVRRIRAGARRSAKPFRSVSTLRETPDISESFFRLQLRCSRRIRVPEIHRYVFD